MPSTIINTFPLINSINTYGSNLQSLVLQGGNANIGGVFSWTSPLIVPNFGSSQQSVTFTPVDASYNQTAFLLEVNVLNKAIPNILTFPQISPIYYTQSLNSSNIQNGQANTPGNFNWRNPNFTPSNAGVQNFDIVFYPDDSLNYSTGVFSAELVVEKADSIINFPNIPKQNLNIQNKYILNATSNHAETGILYSNSNNNVAQINGINLNLLSSGFSTITATQYETSNYKFASVSRELEVIGYRLPKIISISNLPNGVFYNKNLNRLEGAVIDEGTYHIKLYLEESNVLCEKTIVLNVSNKNKKYIYSVNNPVNIGFIKYNAPERIGQEPVIEVYNHPIYGEILRHSKIGVIYGYVNDIKEEIEVYNHPLYGYILRNTRKGVIYGYTGDSNNSSNFINDLYS